MSNRLLPLLLLIIGAGVAGFLGYQGGFEAAVKMQVVGRSHVTSDRREEHRETRSDKMSSLRSLRERSDRSNAAMIESWRIIRGFSVDEIRQALADMPPNSEGNMPGSQLTAMLYYRWAEIDPQEALESAIRIGDMRTAFGAALTAWMNRDPEAAYRWAKSKPELADKSMVYTRMMARVLAHQIPSGALAKASAEGDELRKSVGGMLATNLSATKEGRAAFLAEFAKRGPNELVAGKIQMLTAWGRDDPKGALEGMSELGLDTSGEAASKRQSILSSWSRLDPASALAWMAGKPYALPLATRTQIFTTWAQDDPAAAFEHFDALGNEPGFSEALMNRLLLTNGHVSLNPFVGSSEWIERNRSNLQTCYRRWTALAPEAAARWQDGLNPDLRNELQP